MSNSRFFTPEQLAEGRRNGAAALLHMINGDRHAAFRTLTLAESFAGAVNGLLDVTATLIGRSDETKAMLEQVALAQSLHADQEGAEDE